MDDGSNTETVAKNGNKSNEEKIKTSKKLEEKIKKPEHVINKMYEMNKNDLATYYHQCRGSPTLTTWLKAIKMEISTHVQD